MDAVGFAFVFSTLRLSVPLVIAAFGELVAERAGVLNIGIEGMMLGGAFAAFAVGTSTGSVAGGIAAGVSAGVALAAVFGAFVLWRRADAIVCGTALNVLALGATGSFFRLWFPAMSDVPSTPQVGDILGVNGFVWATLALGLAVALALTRTRLGLSLRAVGERAEAAHAQGIPVMRFRWGATLIGGACAGLAGATLVLWLSNTFVEGMTSGRGFVALALVLFGGYRVWRIGAGGLLFGAATALQFRLQASGTEVPYNLLLMTPYVLTLVVLTLFAGRVRSPGDLARPFER